MVLDNYIFVIAFACLGYLAYCVILFFNKIIKIGNAINKFPMDKKHWLFGHIHMIPDASEGGLKYYRDRCLRYPRACSFWAGNWFLPNVTLHHPETVKLILKTSEPKSMTRGAYKYGKYLMGDGLVFSSGKKWFRNRKLLTNVFHFDMLKEYISIQNERTDVFLNELQKCTEKSRSVEMFSKVTLLTFDIILRCCFSYESDAQEIGENHPLLKAINDLEDLWIKRCFHPWQHFDIFYRFTEDYKEFVRNADFVHKISEEIIGKRKHSMNMDNKRNSDRIKRDFLDVLLTACDEDGVGLTDKEIRDETVTFLIAGHSTTASAISWTLFELAQNPEHQKLCQREIDNLVKNRPKDHMDGDDLHKLTYLNMCIKEALRMHCPIYIIERELQKSLDIDGLELPKEAVVCVQIYALHHNPEVWHEPMKFNPERFSQENLLSLDHFSFVPFSAGPRNCIGQNFALEEIRLVVAKTLRRFKLSLDSSKETLHRMAIVMKPENGMYLELNER